MTLLISPTFGSPTSTLITSTRRTLRRYRRGIAGTSGFLFQQTKDQQVVNLCRKLGFRDVVELSPDEWFELVPGLQILCRPLPADWGECDSWMCLKTERITLLNLNDCEAKTRELAEDIQRRVGAVDVLFTQFSYAGWFGNPNETERRRAAASRKLEWLELQANVLQPRFLVPVREFRVVLSRGELLHERRDEHDQERQRVHT